MIGSLPLTSGYKNARPGSHFMISIRRYLPSFIAPITILAPSGVADLIIKPFRRELGLLQRVISTLEL